MKSSARWIAKITGLMLLSSASGSLIASEGGAPAGAVPSTWQHHKVSFSYNGFTTAYTCLGLEDRMRSMLRYLGARKDLVVHAATCPGPDGRPAHMISVQMEFYTLAPIKAEGADKTDTVGAHWTPVKLVPQIPGFMGDGDCELLQELKDDLSKNFSWRDLQYRTDCFPHSISLNSYSVKGQALKVLPVDQP